MLGGGWFIRGNENVLYSIVALMKTFGYKIRLSFRKISAGKTRSTQTRLPASSYFPEAEAVLFSQRPSIQSLRYKGHFHGL